MNKTVTSKLLACALVAAFALATSIARADGIAAAPSDLEASARTSLKSAIDAFRVDNPGAFARVRNVGGYKPEVYKKTRAGKPTVARELRAHGADALLPMLEALAFDVWDRQSATDVEWRALEVGLLDAVGYLSDPRAEPVLSAAFHNASHADTQRAAAEALGTLCSDDGLGKLAAALSGDKRAAALAGLGMCRTTASAKLLAAQLDATTTASEAAIIAKALGYVASSWAWKSLGETRAAEGLAVRRIASAALVRGFVRHGEARNAHRVGLTMAGHPQLRSIVDKQRGQADQATRDALERIVATIEKRTR